MEVIFDFHAGSGSVQNDFHLKPPLPMLLANAQPESWLQVAAIVAVALVGAWTTVRVHRIEQHAKRSRRLSRAEKQRCDGLERRVVELEKALSACLTARKRRR